MPTTTKMEDANNNKNGMVDAGPYLPPPVLARPGGTFTDMPHQARCPGTPRRVTRRPPTLLQSMLEGTTKRILSARYWRCHPSTPQSGELTAVSACSSTQSEPRDAARTAPQLDCDGPRTGADPSHQARRANTRAGGAGEREG